MSLLARAQAVTFIFIAQPDPPPSGPVNFDWFSGNNWFTNDPVSMSLKHANALPAPGDTAQINGGVNAAANTIHLDTLILSPNASVSGGDFIVSKVQMHGGISGGTTAFTSSIVEVLTEMDVFGGSCAFNTSALNIDFGATCFVGLGGTGQLTLNSSRLLNDGEISLYPNSGSSISGGTNFVNESGAFIVGTSNTFFTVSGNFDNSGVVESDSGTLQVSATTWSCADGLGIFRTTASNAIISIASSLTIPPNTTNIFEGPGPIQLQNGATIQGTALVGLSFEGPNLEPISPKSLTVDPGILQFANTVGGTGMVEVISLPGTPSVLLANSNVSGSITGLVVNVDLGGQFNIGYNLNSLSLSLSGATINNYGTTTWGGHGGVSMSGSTVFNNQPAALFDSQIQNGSIDGTLGNGAPPSGGSFNNYGTFRKSAGTNVLQLAPDFNNSGLLDLESGQVQVYGGTSSGIFSAAPGTEMRLGAASGTRTNYLNAGVQFTGTNFVRLNQNSTLMFNGNITMGKFSFENGTLDGPGTLTVSNVFNWSGNGNIQGIGAINIPTGANWNVVGSGVLVQRTINNFGTMIMSNTSSGSFPGVNTNVVFNNMPGALLQIRNNGGFGFPNPLPVPRPVFNNFGTIQEISGGTAPLSFNITNSGTVLIQSNQFNCYGYEQVAGTTTVSSNATLNPQGFILQGGTVNGLGTIQGSSANGFSISGGVLSPGNPIGVLTMPSGAYTQMVSGTLSITIGGTNVGSQFSRLALNGGMLGGTLNVSFTNGFQPSLGDVYYIVSTPFFGSVTGTFSQLNGLQASNGIVLVPQYQGFGVSLIAATNPVMTSLSRNGNQFTFSFPTTTNLTNVVEFTDTLSPPVWKPLSTNTGDGNVKVVADPSATNFDRFYRVRFR